jgi:hypothetical protein
LTTPPNALLETIRQIVRQEIQRTQSATLAIVQEQHTETDYACTVQLRDSEILLKKVPVATSRMGLASIPAVNDIVLVQFIGGDINRPVISGSLYNDEDIPPTNGDGQWVCQLPLGAGEGEGLQIVANSDGPPSVDIKIGSSLHMTLQDDDPVVLLDISDGAAALSIDSDGTLAIKGGRGISLEAGADLVLKGTNVEIEGSGEVTVKGAVINLN